MRTYNLKTFMCMLGALMVSLTLAQSVCAKDLDSKMVSVKYPKAMKAGEKVDVVFKIKNTGDKKWQGKNFNLLNKIRKSPSGAKAQRDELTPHVYLKDSVNTGATTEFHYKVQAPKWTGWWETEIGMADGRNFFGERRICTFQVRGD